MKSSDFEIIFNTIDSEIELNYVQEVKRVKIGSSKSIDRNLE